jgi:uncharacterized membrane protein
MAPPGSAQSGRVEPESVAQQSGGALAPEGEAAGATQGSGSKASSRLVALDLMRGFIMVVMAWDHSKDIFSSQNASRLNGREGWQGLFSGFDNRWDLFLARAVSNLCAPGFFWVSVMLSCSGARRAICQLTESVLARQTMGIGMSLYSKGSAPECAVLWPLVHASQH